MARRPPTRRSAGRGEQIAAIGRLLERKGDPLGDQGWTLLPQRLHAAREPDPQARRSAHPKSVHRSWTDEPLNEIRPDLRDAIQRDRSKGKGPPLLHSMVDDLVPFWSRHDAPSRIVPLLEHPDRGLEEFGARPGAETEDPAALLGLLGKSRIPEPMRLGLCRLAVELQDDEDTVDAVAMRLPRPLGLYLLRAWQWSAVLPKTRARSRAPCAR